MASLSPLFITPQVAGGSWNPSRSDRKAKESWIEMGDLPVEPCL